MVTLSREYHEFGVKLFYHGLIPLLHTDLLKSLKREGWSLRGLRFVLKFIKDIFQYSSLEKIR